MDERRLEALLDLLENAPPEDAVPTSAIRDLRGRRTQTELATKSGITQPFLAQLESGARPLTKDVALKLAASLDVEPEDLELAEHISAMQREAANGDLDPRRVLDLILELAYVSGDDETRDAALDGLLVVAKRALSTYQNVRQERRELRERGEAVVNEESREVATKAARRRSTRDAHGRRLNKPYGGR